jgi:Ca2+-binding RTX toxin-like protein
MPRLNRSRHSPAMLPTASVDVCDTPTSPVATPARAVPSRSARGFLGLALASISLAIPYGIGTGGAAHAAHAVGSAEGGGPAMCRQQPATLVGTPGDDTLMGTPGDDVIVGLGGIDTIFGEGGHDVICGGSNPHRIEEHDDHEDTLYEYLDGGTGADIIDAGPGPGFDVIAAGSGADLLLGGAGNDLIQGGKGPDRIRSGPGDDGVYGDQGRDRVDAGVGADRLIGGNEHDVLDGGPGDDLLDGAKDNDVVIGGLGFDTMDYEEKNYAGGSSSHTVAITVNLRAGVGGGRWFGRDQLTGIEGVRTGWGNDILIGDSAPNVFSTGWRGSGVIRGGPGRDTLTFADVCCDGRLRMDLQTGRGRFNRGALSVSSIENLTGGSDEDVLLGDEGANLLVGGGPRFDFGDVIRGRGGRDQLIGFGGDDRLYGGPDNDRLSGSRGDDTLIGGPGADRNNGGLGEDLCQSPGIPPGAVNCETSDPAGAPPAP